VVNKLIEVLTKIWWEENIKFVNSIKNKQ